MTVAQGALNAVMNANPLAIVALAVVGLVTALVTLYNTNEDFRKAVQKVWATIKKTVLNVIDALKKGFESWVFIIQQVWGKIKNVLSPVAEWIGNKFTTAVDNVKEAFSGVVDFFKGIWKGIKGAFSKVTDWFKTTFQTAWEGVKKVFTTGGKVFEGMKEGILSVFKSVVNGLIGGINKVIKVPFDGINKALKAIKNVKIGPAKPFKGLISLIDVPEIPKLATGAVIEPNNPFLAMLGDQKNGVNIETPLSTMVDAFNKSLDNRKVDDEGIQLLRNINSMLEEMNLEADIREAVQGLEFRANEREVARVVRKYANA
jgi:phage-related protein